MTGRCPHCSGRITAPPDERGILLCGQCGARLRASARRSGTAPALPPRAAVTASATAPPVRRAAGPASTPGFDALLAEIRTLVASQAEVLQTLREVLALLRSGAAAPQPQQQRRGDEDAAVVPGFEWHVEAAAAAPRPRTRQRRKSVLVVDDDPQARESARAAFEAAHVRVRLAADGCAAIAAIAEDKPDVVVLELGLADPMTGRDVINMIRATMEWVDIPILLHTRVPIESHKEARTVHGADDFLAKHSGSTEALVAKVVHAFQKA